MRTLVRAIVNGRVDEVRLQLKAAPTLATAVLAHGATRQRSTEYFFAEVKHYMYAGDTPLHMAGAAFQRSIARLLVAHGADHRARNRRGAQPLHYAADTNHWDPDAQADTIDYFLSIGADPNAVDNDGVAPLHRAIRTRSAAAVRALLDGGADPARPNGRGSTPLQLALKTTGRSGSGSPLARRQQQMIERLLRERLTAVVG